MRKPALLIAGTVLALGSGALAWWQHRTPAEPVPAADEKAYQDIERPEYEKWMQDLGYTE